MKYSKTAIGLLSAQYRSVLKKCFLINMGLFALGVIATPANAADYYVSTTSGGSNDTQITLGTAASTDASAYATSAQGAKADSALQASDIGEGSANGTISVNGSNVAVHGLGSAAYTDSSAYDSAGTAAGLVNALDAVETQTAGADGLSLSITQTDGKILSISGAIAANTYDSYGTASGLVNALDAVETQTAGADGLSLSITQTDGKIMSISGAIAANTYDSYGTASGLVNALDAVETQTAGADGLSLSITQTDGKIMSISGAIAAGTYDAAGAAAAVQGSTTETVASVNAKVAGKVDNTTTINGHALSSNVTLTASDVGADAAGAAAAVQGATTETVASVDAKVTGKVDKTTTINGHALNSNVTLTASDVGADATGTAAGLINALDASAAQTAGADGLALNITQVDGKITAISGSIAANTYDAYGAATGVQTAIEGKLDDGAAGYDIDAKTLKVQGADVLTASSALNGANITAGTVAKTALASDVQTSLGKADTALQAGANISSLTNDAGYITASVTKTDTTATTAFSATATNTSIPADSHTFAVTSTGVKVDGQNVLTEGSSIDGANITDGTITLSKIASSAIQGATDPVTYTGTKLTTQGYVDETKASILAGTGYSGSGLETAVTSTVTANAADGTYSSSGTYAANTIGNAIKTAQTDITALQTATTFTTDGNYYVSTDTVANAVKKVDTQVKTNTGNIATNTSNIATINTKMGAVENLFSTGSSPIGRGDSVAAILSSVDTELDAATAKNTAQDTKLSGLAAAIGGTYDSTTNVFTKNTYGTTLYTVNDAQSLTTAIGALDNALGSVATAKSAVAGASTATNLSDIVAQLSDNLTNGTVNAEFANTTVDSLTIDGTSFGITSTGAANMYSLDIGTTGKGFDNAGNAKTGTLTIGTANAITGTGTSLDINGNDLANVKNLTTTGNATIGGNASITGTLSAGATTIAASGSGATTALSVTATDTSSSSTTAFTVASDKATVTGNLDVSGTLGVGANTKMAENDTISYTSYGSTTPATGQKVLEVSGVNAMAVDGKIAATNGLSVATKSGTTYTEVFNVDNTGSISSDMLKTDNGGNTVTLGKDTSTKNILNGSLQFGTATGTPTVNAIDDGTTAATSAGTNNATTMATLASVLKSAENADYTVGASAKNITEATTGSGKTTLHTAIDTLDTEIGADTDYASTVNGVAGANSVKTNISNVNAALGDVSTVDVNGYAPTAPATKNLTDAVTKLNTNMNNVLGGVYKADGTYDAGQLVGDGFSAAVAPATASLTQSLKDYAANVETATGGTFATTGVWTGTVTMATSPDYTYGGTTGYANIMAAVSNLASTVGDATGLNAIAARTTAVANNGVAATNTVNANINALNATIGDLTGLNTTLGNLTNGGATNPATVVKALNNIDATLGKIHGLYDNTTKTVNSTTITSTVNGNSNLASGTTVEDHLVSLDNAIGNRQINSLNNEINTAVAGDATAAAGTEANNGSLALGLKAAGDAIGDMNFTNAHYVAGNDNLSDAVRSLDSNLYRVESEMHDLKRDFNRGMASMAAMSALVPNPRASGNTSLSIGTGAYSGHTAAAIGGFHYLTDNIMLNAGAAWGNSSDVSYRMGITVSW